MRQMTQFLADQRFCFNERLKRFQVLAVELRVFSPEKFHGFLGDHGIKFTGRDLALFQKILSGLLPHLFDGETGDQRGIDKVAGAFQRDEVQVVVFDEIVEDLGDALLRAKLE